VSEKSRGGSSWQKRRGTEKKEGGAVKKKRAKRKLKGGDQKKWETFGEWERREGVDDTDKSITKRKKKPRITDATKKKARVREEKPAYISHKEPRGGGGTRVLVEWGYKENLLGSVSNEGSLIGRTKQTGGGAVGVCTKKKIAFPTGHPPSNGGKKETKKNKKKKKILLGVTGG